MNPRKPRIVIVLGDPAGIGPELVGRLLGDPASATQADIVLLADAAELERGMDLAGRRTAVQRVAGLDAVDFSRAPKDTPLHIDYRGDTQGPFQRGVSTADGGRYSLDTLALGLQAVQRGVADAMVFAPFNKHSLHLAGMKHQRRAALVRRAARLPRPGLRVQRARRPVDLARHVARRAARGRRRGSPSMASRAASS